jgi:hypothetical protein
VFCFLVGFSSLALHVFRFMQKALTSGEPTIFRTTLCRVKLNYYPSTSKFFKCLVPVTRRETKLCQGMSPDGDVSPSDFAADPPSHMPRTSGWHYLTTKWCLPSDHHPAKSHEPRYYEPKFKIAFHGKSIFAPGCLLNHNSSTSRFYAVWKPLNGHLLETRAA